MLAVREGKRRARLREQVQAAKRRGELTPEVVAAHAYLHIEDDYGLPITPAAHHWLWLELLCDVSIRRLLIIAPPESAKTTWLLAGFVGAYVGFWPENNVIVAGSAGDVARRRSLAVRTMTESPEWRKTYPGVEPARGLSYTDQVWSVAPGGMPRPGRIHPTMSAYGTGGPITGSRADLLIADDILDLENTKTAYQRRMVITWFYKSFLSRLKSTGRVVVIGTAWTHDDVYSKLRKEGNWVVCHMPQLSPVEGRSVAFLTYPDSWQGRVIGEPMVGSVEGLMKGEDDD